MQQVSRPGRAADALNVQYFQKCVSVYLSGQEDWKFVMAIIRESGLGKREAYSLLLPLKGQGWKFRSQALFAWLETP